MKRILFVAGQSAAANYLAPIWRRNLAGQALMDFRLAVHDSASRAMSNLAGLPIVRSVESESELSAALGDWQPDLVLTSLSGRPVERAGFELARRLRRPIWQFVDTWYDYALRIDRTNGSHGLPDRLLVIDDRARREAIDDGIPDHIIVAVGHPAWEIIVPEPAHDTRAVLFVSQPIARYWGESLGYTEATGWQMVCRAAEQRPDLFPRVLFAPHPEEEPNAVGQGPAERIESGQAGIRIAGCVLGLYSSVMVDALLVGRKVISVQPDAGIMDKCSLSRHGFVRRARDTAELLQLMQDDDVRSITELRAAVAGSRARLERVMLDGSRA